MIDPIEYSELGRSLESKSQPTEHDVFACTIRVGSNVITYKFHGGQYSKYDKSNNFTVLLATYVHQETGIHIQLVENDCLQGASEQLANWIEEQVLKHLSDVHNIEEA